MASIFHGWNVISSKKKRLKKGEIEKEEIERDEKKSSISIFFTWKERRAKLTNFYQRSSLKNHSPYKLLEFPRYFDNP